MMNIRKLWSLPIHSGHFDTSYFLDDGLNSSLFFEYSDDTTQNQAYHGCLTFQDVMAFRNSTEMFTKIIDGSYDTIVEVPDSDWIRELTSINPDRAGFWGMRHLAIYLKDLGLYEFAARDFEFTGPKPGKLTPEDIWILKD